MPLPVIKYVPRVAGPFVAPQGLGAKPAVPTVVDVPQQVTLQGTSLGDSDTTGSLRVTWALGGTTDGAGLTGFPVYPATTQYPGVTFYPGSAGSPVAVKWGLAGTSAGSSAMGYLQFPAASLFPDAAFYPGVIPATLELVQYARPVADVAAAGWVVAPLWSKLDETVPSDADLVTGVAS